jgi:hypothetical protein
MKDKVNGVRDVKTKSLVGFFPSVQILLHQGNEGNEDV